MDTKPYNWFAQELLSEVLSATGTSKPELKVARSTQFVDFTFVPGAGHGRQRRELGLLGQMTPEPCLIEAFHGTPTLTAILECQSKQLILHHRHHLEAQKTGRAQPKVPWLLWVVSAGRPREVIEALGLTPLPGAPPGVLRGPTRGNPMGLVVTSELPKTRETLLVRLLGADRVLEDASLEVARLRMEDPIRRWAGQLLVELKLRVEQDPGVSQQEKERLHMATLTLLEAYGERIHRGALQEGLKKGLEKGREEGLEKGREQGVSAGEAKALLAVLRARGIRVSSAAEKRIISCTDAKQVERWVERAALVTQVGELFSTSKVRKRTSRKSTPKSRAR